MGNRGKTLEKAWPQGLEAFIYPTQTYKLEGNVKSDGESYAYPMGGRGNSLHLHMHAYAHRGGSSV